jgi:hypothetical protein
VRAHLLLYGTAMKSFALWLAAACLAACSSSPSDALPSGAGGGDASGTPPVATPPPPGLDAAGPGQDASPPTPPGDAATGGDAANADGGTEGGAPSCAGLAYCDDFESYDGVVKNGATLGPWKASVGGVAVMTVDTVKPHSGAKSLHITVPAGAAANGTLNQKVAAGLVKGNDLFGRAMVFYSNAGGNDLPNGVHSWTFNASGNSAASGGNVSMNLANGGTNYFLNYHPAKGNEQSVTGGKPSAGVWHCMQWQYDGSGTPPADTAKIWVDGTAVVTVTAATKWDLAAPWDSMDFGFTHYQTTTKPIDVYLDDFAVNGTMVPCPP